MEKTTLEKYRARVRELALQKRAGADLAGNCEGEDIADLIDLARSIATNSTTPAVTKQVALGILARIEGRR